MTNATGANAMTTLTTQARTTAWQGTAGRRTTALLIDRPADLVPNTLLRLVHCGLLMSFPPRTVRAFWREGLAASPPPAEENGFPRDLLRRSARVKSDALWRTLAALESLLAGAETQPDRFWQAVLSPQLPIDARDVLSLAGPLLQPFLVTADARSVLAPNIRLWAPVLWPGVAFTAEAGPPDTNAAHVSCTTPRQDPSLSMTTS